MAKKLNEKLSTKRTLSATGFLNLENMTIEVEEVGVVELKTVLKNFDGQFIKLNVSLEDVEEVDITDENGEFLA